MDYAQVKAQRELSVQLINELKRSGLSIEELGHRLEWTVPKVVRVLSGSTSVGDLRVFLTYCGQADERRIEELILLLKEGRSHNSSTMGLAGFLQDVEFYYGRGSGPPQRPLYWDYLRFESSATAISSWQGLMIPDLLQTKEYADTLLREELIIPPEIIPEVLTLLDHRQVWLRRDDGPALVFFIDEAVFTQIASPQIMKNQLVEIYRICSTNSKVKIRILRLTADASINIKSGLSLIENSSPPTERLFRTESVSEFGMIIDEAGGKLFKSLFTFFDEHALTHDESLSLVREWIRKEVPYPQLAGAPLVFKNPETLVRDSEVLTAEKIGSSLYDTAARRQISGFIDTRVGYQGAGGNSGGGTEVHYIIVWIIQAMVAGVLGNAATSWVKAFGARISINSSRRRPRIGQDEAKILVQHAFMAYLKSIGKRPGNIPAKLTCSAGEYRGKTWYFAVRYRNVAYRASLHDTGDLKKINVTFRLL